MNELQVTAMLPPCSNIENSDIDLIRGKLEQLPQYDLRTEHLFHAGMYIRTVRIPAGHMLVGVMIKIPTVLIIDGKFQIYHHDRTDHYSGYYVLPGSAMRRTALFAETDTCMSMSFCTRARTIQEAEKEFTDDYLDLVSNSGNNDIQITGE